MESGVVDGVPTVMPPLLVSTTVCTTSDVTIGVCALPEMLSCALGA